MSTRQKWFQLFMGAVLVFYSHFALNSAPYNFFSVKLPIAIKGAFPIPVVFWLEIFAYTVAVSFIFKIKFKDVLKKLLVYGFFIHLLFMLLKLKVQIVGNPRIFSSVIYGAYCELFIFISFICLVLFCAREFFRLDSFSVTSFFTLVYSIGFLYFYGFILQVFILAAVFVTALYIYRNKRILNSIRNILRQITGLWGREKLFLWVIFLAGIMIRLFYLWRIMSTPDYIATGSDGPLYDSLAWSFSQGQKVTEPLVSGYWMFLALLYKFLGRNYALACFVQGVLTSLSCVFIYYSAKYIFNIRVGRIAALLSVLSFSSIFSAAAIGHQALDIFYSTLSLMLVCRYATEKSERRSSFILLGCIGVVFGLSIATREVNFFYPFMALAWLIITLKRKFKLSMLIRDAIVVLFFMALTLTPFVLRNIKNLGVWYPVSSAKGANYPLIEVYLKGENPELAKAGIDLSRPDLLFRLTVKRPLFVSRIIGNTLWNKFKEVYFSQGYGGFDMVFLYRLSSYYYALWFYVYILFLAGLFLAFHKYRCGLHCLAAFFIINRTTVHLLTESSYRHRAAIEPFLLIYLSFGIYMLLTAHDRDRFLQ